MKHDQFPKSKKVIAAAGVALALAACSASPKNESAPTREPVATALESTPETTTMVVPNPDSLVGKDKEEYEQTLSAVTEANRGYPALALSHANTVDDEGSFTKVQARDIVEPAITQYAVTEANRGYPALALSHANTVDDEGTYIRSQAVSEVNAAIDHPK